MALASQRSSIDYSKETIANKKAMSHCKPEISSKSAIANWIDNALAFSNGMAVFKDLFRDFLGKKYLLSVQYFQTST